MPDAVKELLGELVQIRVSSALNIYDEECSVSCGDLPGQATERLLALEHYLRSRLVRAGRAGGRSAWQGWRPMEWGAVHLAPPTPWIGTDRADCDHRAAGAFRSAL